VNMISLKNPPPDKKSKKHDSMPVSPMHDEYPYNTRLTLSDGQAEKFDALSDVSVDDVLTITAKVKVIAVRSSEHRGFDGKGEPKKEHSVELQMTDMAIEPDNDGAMQGGFDAADKPEE